jgi:hypothetical protein
MNEPDVDTLLRGARLPQRPDEYWDEFPSRVIRRLQAEKRGATRPRPWRLGVSLAAAAACGLVVGFVIWHRRPAPGGIQDALRDGRVLRELQAQYPGRLRAIIQDEKGMHTQLSDLADVAASDPVWLEIRDGSDDRVVVTFSGQLVRFGSRDVMVLSDLGGQVMLVGDGFFWSHQVSTGLARTLQIRAEQIPSAQNQRKPAPPF